VAYLVRELIPRLAGDGAQGVLRGLGPVRSGEEHREERVFRSLVLEMGTQTNSCDGVHQVAEVKPRINANGREFLPATLSPFRQ
jgi:hypothetical protein